MRGAIGPPAAVLQPVGQRGGQRVHALAFGIHQLEVPGEQRERGLRVNAADLDRVDGLEAGDTLGIHAVAVVARLHVDAGDGGRGVVVEFVDGLELAVLVVQPAHRPGTRTAASAGRPFPA